ncbi:hypothetical protein HU200_008289 [Digitaria exilis]|uniref:SAWADEE domain-containing protein n=1 Tax=Digitaria exilis TaxID=1010633 RepID=A0A835KRW1_9POAL|nr:hypothetical protein HU200_008289 [Digitaria exilis]CAB3465391.1 unnamed protein product [Digitaria exilis]
MPPTARKRKRKAPSSSSSRRTRAVSRLDFRSAADGAWYAARVAAQGGALRVMYEEFPEEQDEWYDPAALAAVSSPSRHGVVAALRARFRMASPPLDDARCRDLRPGTPLCVSCPLDAGLLKFYDAFLESVLPAAHGTVDGEERCACRFAVRWTEGPRAGSREEVGVERVCCVQSSPVQDPVLNEFLDGVTRLLGNGSGVGATASQATGAVAAAEGGGVPGDAPPGFHRKFGARP